ncbi:MAG: hypothetical protein AB9888_12925 [Bacteroidales bacterium]
MDSLQNFETQLSNVMKFPGAIFKLPVSYNLPYPCRFLIRQDGSKLMAPSEHSVVSIGNVWQNEETKQYHGLKPKEVILQAKVRPFLILRRFELKNVFWQGDYYFGLPIASVKERMINTPAKQELLYNNQSDYLHYIPESRSEITGLDKPSVVVISTPVFIPKRFFTHYLGYIEQDELSCVRQKLQNFTNMNK